MPVNYGHHRSDRIAEILSPLCGIRDEQIKKGVKPHDHARDNVLRIRAMQKLANQNLADLAPHPLIEFLLHDHPSLARRIAWAQKWQGS